MSRKGSAGPETRFSLYNQGTETPPPALRDFPEEGDRCLHFPTRMLYSRAYLPLPVTVKDRGGWRAPALLPPLSLGISQPSSTPVAQRGEGSAQKY